MRVATQQLLCASGRQNPYRHGEHLALHDPLARRRRARLAKDKVDHVHAIDYVSEDCVAGITTIRLSVQ